MKTEGGKEIGAVLTDPEAAGWAATEYARLAGYVKEDTVELLQALEFSVLNQRSEAAAAREAARERRVAAEALRLAGKKHEIAVVEGRAEDFEYRAAQAEARAAAVDLMRREELNRHDTLVNGGKELKA